MSNNSLKFKSIREISNLIKNKKISSQEVTKYFLKRLSDYGDKYNAIVTLLPELAEKLSSKADKLKNKGLLHGIPYGIKDLISLSYKDLNINKNYTPPTTWGASPLKSQKFEFTATVIKKLNKAGAIPLVKLSMVELAGGMGYKYPNASITGPGINPWDITKWAGGSSSGSGSAVAAGLVPFALGTETWGSILIPSAYCGITGLRPTLGIVSKHGTMALSWTLDKIGPMGLSADDCGIVLNAISGFDPKDSSSSRRKFSYISEYNPQSKPKLAIFRNILNDCSKSVKINFHNSVNELSKFANIDEIDLPQYPYESIIQTISNAESYSALENIIDSGALRKLTAIEDRYSAIPRTLISAKDYIKALRMRRVTSSISRDIFQEYDGLIAPTRPSTALPLNENFRDSFISSSDPMGSIGNLAGLPAISLPNGFEPKSKLPTGLQIMSSPYSENFLISMGKKFQSVTDWHKQNPKI
ncbi:MAG: amidase [Chloroflexi bacterium]|nr:amidase [Chloroflexota bacterium]